MKFHLINQHKQITINGIPNDFDYLSVHQEYSVEQNYLAFYLIVLGVGVEIVI